MRKLLHSYHIEINITNALLFFPTSLKKYTLHILNQRGAIILFILFLTYVFPVNNMWSEHLSMIKIIVVVSKSTLSICYLTSPFCGHLNYSGVAGTFDSCLAYF